MNEIKITPEEIGKAAELIRKVAEGTTQPTDPLTSWEIAKILEKQNRVHTREFSTGFLGFTMRKRPKTKRRSSRLHIDRIENRENIRFGN